MPKYSIYEASFKTILQHALSYNMGVQKGIRKQRFVRFFSKRTCFAIDIALSPAPRLKGQDRGLLTLDIYSTSQRCRSRMLAIDFDLEDTNYRSIHAPLRSSFKEAIEIVKTLKRLD